MVILYVEIACEQALPFGRVKRVSRERASGRRSREGQRKGAPRSRSREARFACPNRRACSQANVEIGVILWPSYRLYIITLSIHFSFFPACFYERCIWEALSVEVSHEYLVVFSNKSVKNLFRFTARSLAVFTIITPNLSIQGNTATLNFAASVWNYIYFERNDPCSCQEPANVN